MRLVIKPIHRRFPSMPPRWLHRKRRSDHLHTDEYQTPTRIKPLVVFHSRSAQAGPPFLKQSNNNDSLGPWGYRACGFSSQMLYCLRIICSSVLFFDPTSRSCSAIADKQLIAATVKSVLSTERNVFRSSSVFMDQVGYGSKEYIRALFCSASLIRNRLRSAFSQLY